MNIGDIVIKKGHPALIDPVAAGIGVVTDIRDVPTESIQVTWNISKRSYWYDPMHLIKSNDYVEWMYCSRSLPESCSPDESCNPYYLIELDGATNMLAMFMNGEWWSSYTCKVMVPVKRWLCTNVDAHFRRRIADRYGKDLLENKTSDEKTEA